jgi:hypothetical protein
MDVTDGKRYIDLVKHFEGVQSYQDWEGFADGAEVKARVDEALKGIRQDTSEVHYELLLHYCYTMTDTYQLPTIQEVVDAWSVIEMILGARWWLKSTAR